MMHLRAWRLGKFSAVGALGIGVQLTVLAALLGVRMNYLVATAAAVECAVLHNFVWHQRFTWRDRLAEDWHQKLLRMFRFHVSNGAISLVGNVVLMRVLVGYLHISAVIANMLAITACFAFNFLVCDGWVFAPDRENAECLHKEMSVGM